MVGQRERHHRPALRRLGRIEHFSGKGYGQNLAW
jgi:hypothetical protein